MIPPVSNVHRKGGKFHCQAVQFALSSFSESISICVFLFRSYPDGDGGMQLAVGRQGKLIQKDQN